MSTFSKISTLWNICQFCLITIQCLYFGTNLCLAQITQETLQIRPPITKKYCGKNKTRRINNRFVTHPIVCSKCQKDGHNRRICNTISYSRFGQVKDIILEYSVHLSMILSTFLTLCPYFRVYVHILEYLSTFRNICPNFRIYVHNSEYMSTFPSKYCNTPSSECVHSYVSWFFSVFSDFLLFKFLLI